MSKKVCQFTAVAQTGTVIYKIPKKQGDEKVQYIFV